MGRPWEHSPERCLEAWLLFNGLEVGEDSKKLYGSFAASVAIATAAAIVVNLSLASKEITLIEILPDSPDEKAPKPTNKDSTPRPKQTTFFIGGGETLLTALVPLDLTPTHRHSSTKYTDS